MMRVFTATKSVELDTSETYFDCTNFYFEIDRGDDFRKKEPGKKDGVWKGRKIREIHR